MKPFPPPAPEKLRSKSSSRWLSNLPVLFGVICLAYVGASFAQSRLAQTWAAYVFDHCPPGNAAITEPVSGQWLGRLEIPRLNVSAMVREGDDDSTLRIAVGHLPGTALPGQPGTIALAGHRDTFFRALRSIRSNDLIRLQTQFRRYEYVVEEIKIVSPKQTEVLRSNSDSMLSLITCYPFNYVGSAPQRFVVRAKETQETRINTSDRPRSASTEDARARKHDQR